MKDKKVVIIGGSGFIGSALAKEMMLKGWVLHLCYLNNKNILIETAGQAAKSYYLNIKHTDDQLYLKEIFDDTSLVIDASSESLEASLAFQDKLLSSVNIPYFIHITNENVNDEQVRKGTYFVQPDILYGPSSRLTQEVLAVSAAKVSLVPVDPMTLGSPLHIQDFATLVTMLTEKIFDQTVFAHIFSVHGRSKMTLKYFLHFIAKAGNQSLLFTFTLPKSYADKVNAFTKKNIEWGYSERVWREISSFDKRFEATNLAEFLSEGVLSLEARENND